jgi:hypothetical protein
VRLQLAGGSNFYAAVVANGIERDFVHAWRANASPSVLSFERSPTMPHSIGPLLVLLTLAASAAAFSCSSRPQQVDGENEPAGASGSAVQSGAAGATPGGQPGQAGAATGGVPAGGDAAGGSLVSGAGGAVAPIGGATSRAPQFVKTRLSAEFYSEGINYGDLDRDGKRDIIAGPHWYPGPGYTEQRAFRQPRAEPFDVSGDSDCYSIFVYDFNQDGWLDILSFRLAGGAEAVWYENNQGAEGYWAEHVVFSVVDNESATFADIDGDAKPELITVSNGFGGWAQPNWSNPQQPWTFRNVTEKGSWARYTHGLGIGDVNADGRADLLLPEGWWEQPLSSSSSSWASHPAKFWGQAVTGESYGGAQMFADDVDGDGDADIVTSLQAHGWGLAWFERTGTSFVQHLLMNTRDEEERYGVAFAQLHAVDLADVDGDGLKDIVTGKRKGAHGNGLGAELTAPAVLYWFQLIREPGQPPRYAPHLIDSEAGVGTQVVVADVNEDGLPDILTAARAGAFLFLNQ